MGVQDGGCGRPGEVGPSSWGGRVDDMGNVGIQGGWRQARQGDRPWPACHLTCCSSCCRRCRSSKPELTCGTARRLAGGVLSMLGAIGSGAPVCCCSVHCCGCSWHCGRVAEPAPPAGPLRPGAKGSPVLPSPSAACCCRSSDLLARPASELPSWASCRCTCCSWLVLPVLALLGVAPEVLAGRGRSGCGAWPAPWLHTGGANCRSTACAGARPTLPAQATASAPASTGGRGPTSAASDTRPAWRASPGPAAPAAPGSAGCEATAGPASSPRATGTAPSSSSSSSLSTAKPAVSRHSPALSRASPPDATSAWPPAGGASCC